MSIKNRVIPQGANWVGHSKLTIEAIEDELDGIPDIVYMRRPSKWVVFEVYEDYINRVSGDTHEYRYSLGEIYFDKLEPFPFWPQAPTKQFVRGESDFGGTVEITPPTEHIYDLPRAKTVTGAVRLLQRCEQGYIKPVHKTMSYALRRAVNKRRKDRCAMISIGPLQGRVI